MITSKKIINAASHVLQTVNIPKIGKKHGGKVRDFYFLNEKRILITTDRQSAFNYNLGFIPFKGAVLNMLSKFWFDKTKKIVTNHMIAVPDANVMVAHNCEPIPVEMVVRGYLTGVAVTSIWYSYQKGERKIYDLDFPDGMKKNEKLSQPIITPTSHPDAESGSHVDERLTRKQIIKEKIVPEKLYLQMEKAALELFEFGSNLCKKRGLILVDTKYEFGLYKGKLTLIDEIHTPDSSRFWIEKTYQSRFKKGLEPENFDKEFLRLYYRNKLDYKDNKVPPKMPRDLVIALSKRYIAVYEKITGKKFTGFEYPVEKRILKNVASYLNK